MILVVFSYFLFLYIVIREHNSNVIVNTILRFFSLIFYAVLRVFLNPKTHFYLKFPYIHSLDTKFLNFLDLILFSIKLCILSFSKINFPSINIAFAPHFIKESSSQNGTSTHRTFRGISLFGAHSAR